MNDILLAPHFKLSEFIKSYSLAQHWLRHHKLIRKLKQ